MFLKNHYFSRNIKYMMLFVASLSMVNSLQGMTPEEQSKRPFFVGILKLGIIQNSFEPQLRKCVALLKKENYQKEVETIRDMLMDKYRHNDLPSISETKHAHVKSVDIHVIDTNHIEPFKQALRETYSKLASCVKDEVHNDIDPFRCRPFVDAYQKAAMIEDGARKMKEAPYIAGKMCHEAPNPEVCFNGRCFLMSTFTPVILLNSKNLDVYSSAERHDITYHEFGHAFDRCIGSRDNECYSSLKKEVENLKISSDKVELAEWYATKQGGLWLQTYNPELARQMACLFEADVIRRQKINPWPTYPSPAVRLAWLRDSKVECKKD